MEKILILLLPVVTIPAAIIYQNLRSKMTRPKPSNPIYSTIRVLKLININFFLNLTLVLVNIYVTSVIFSRVIFTPFSVFILALYAISLFIVLYGCGIYVTTVVLNCYLKDPITNAELKADHLLHGVISHILMLSGWLLVLFFQVILEVNFARPEFSALQQPLFFAGLIYGFVFAVLQIINDTYIYQMLVSLVTGLIFYINIFAISASIKDHPIAGFYLGFIFVCSSILLSHVVYRIVTKKKISWNRAKYRY